MSVSVVIPTYKRPEGLRLAIESVIAQSHQPDEILVVDNDPAGSARTMAATAKAVARCEVVYVHAPEPGVSNARNAGLAAAKGRFIAFLDDDEIASGIWLESLLRTAEAQSASVVFGPLTGQAQNAGGLAGDLARRLYSRVGPDADTMIPKPYGCGNSLVDRAAFDLPDAPFDPDCNELGGEDDRFFAMLAEQGARFAWSVKAHGVETVSPERTTLRYLLARSFAFGQGATQGAHHARNPAKVLFWMAVGLAQMLVFGPLAALSLLAMPSRAAEWLDKTVQAAGKVFWFDRFNPRFYGVSSQVAG